MRRKIFSCACGSIEHQLVVTYFDDDPIEAPVCYLEMHLKHLPFWHRVGYAIRYVLGKQSDTGAFAEVILDAPTALGLGDVLIERASGIPSDFPTSDVY